MDPKSVVGGPKPISRAGVQVFHCLNNLGCIEASYVLTESPKNFQMSKKYRVSWDSSWEMLLYKVHFGIVYEIEV